ncbi:unnamed protein product [Caenorhabditis brenneri]
MRCNIEEHNFRQLKSPSFIQKSEVDKTFFVESTRVSVWMRCKMKGQKLLRRQPDFLQLITPTFIQIAVVDKTFFVESAPSFCLNVV